MNRINYTRSGGLPVDQEGLDFMQQAYTTAIAAIAKGYGNKAIVTGMEVGGSSVASGWLVYNGELIKFNASTIANYVKISESSISVLFEDGLNKAVYYEKTAVCDVTGDFQFSELVRIEPFTKPLKTKYDNVWLSGDIKMIYCTNEYRDIYFDLSGLGRLERLGWKICNGLNDTIDFGGRVPVGFDGNTIDPNNNVWDVDYNTIGSTGGEKKHQLSIGELPEFDLPIPQGDSFTGPGGTRVGRGSANPNNSSTLKIGGNEPHENRQPFVTVLFIQKI